MLDADVIVVGAGPTGLMLAGELQLNQARALVLERRPQLGQTAKANGFNGQILEVLRYRGLLLRFETACGRHVHPAHEAPFGGVHPDFTQLADPPLNVLSLPQPQLERLLDEHAGELGADVRRGHQMTDFAEQNDGVTAVVQSPGGPYRVTARYLVGCDGPGSRVRALAGIPFPGLTYPEVNRLGEATLSDAITQLGNGDLDVPGFGRIRRGITRTDRGVFAFGSLSSGVLLIQTTENERLDGDDDAPMTLVEFQDSIYRVLGASLPLREVRRLSRYRFQARQAERYRQGRIMLAGDAAHQFPATGIGINVGMLDAVNLGWKLAAEIHGWAPAALLDSYHEERHFAGVRSMMHTQAQVALRRGDDPAAEALRQLFVELVRDEQPLRRIGALIAATDTRYPTTNPDRNRHPLTGSFVSNLPLRTDDGTTSIADLMRSARPILLDLANRPELRRVASSWQHRVDVHSARADHRPADALLIRPDAHIAWAASVDEPAEIAALTLREALADWFAAPLKPADSTSESSS